MATWERVKIGVYFVVFFVAIMNRNTDPAWAVIGAQFVFSEQILSRYLRVEWLRIETSEVFDELFRLIQSKPAKDRLEGMVLELLGHYETAKATAGITLSERIFNRKQAELDSEWKKVVAMLQDDDRKPVDVGT